MKNPYQRKKDPQLNKKLILETAADIGSNKSWNEVTFQAIADKTGLSKGGIIHHFPSKQLLLEEIFDLSLVELGKLIDDEIKNNPDITPAYAYLKIVCSDISDTYYTDTMRVILKGTVNEEYFRDKWKKWVSENIFINFESEENTISILYLLLADGLWFSDTAGIYPIDKIKKEKILTIMKNIKI